MVFVNLANLLVFLDLVLTNVGQDGVDLIGYIIIALGDSFCSITSNYRCLLLYKINCRPANGLY